MVVRGDGESLTLEGLKCSGDLSRVCCNVPALGQPVVVTGTLTWKRHVIPIGASWELANPRICEIR